ncbi:galanin receptor 2a-like [Macrobrachium rosenbergii]|uniref:galanin receptor 2a-like n=1 Tax=Macrobrachium rosenbergii TaxID=79674 RepID=UPI0034D4076F
MNDSLYPADYVDQDGGLWDSNDTENYYSFANESVDKMMAITIDDPDDLRRPWKTIPFFYVYIITYLITLIFGMIGNVAVILLMAGDRKSRTTTNMFLVSLSVADLLMLVLCVPLETVYFFVVLWDSGGAACKMANYFMMLSFTASVLNLTAVSLERFIVIVFPMRSRSLCTMSNCRRSVLFVWVVSLILACPIIKVMEAHTVVYTNPSRTEWVSAHYCKPMDSLVFLTYQLLVLFVIPALLMIAFYTAVIRELWKSTKTIKALTSSRGTGCSTTPSDNYHLKVSTSSGGGNLAVVGRAHVGGVALRNGRLGGSDSAYNSSNSLYVPYATTANRSRTPSPTARHLHKKHKEKSEDVKKARKQVIKMLIVVVILFLLCWGPTIVMEICINLGFQKFDQIFYSFNIGFKLLPFIHCCINPIIYCFMSKNFRRSMKRMLGDAFRPFARSRGKCCPPQQRPLQVNLLQNPKVVTQSTFTFSYSEPTPVHTHIETVSSM